MYHGCGNERKLMLSERKGVSFLYNDLPVLIIRAEKLLHHHKCFCRGNNLGILIYLHKISDIGRVIRLHMLDDQVIRLAGTQNRSHVVQPFVGEMGVHSVHDCGLLIQDHIRIVSHAVFHNILSLKQIYLMVIDTYVSDIVCNIHLLYTPFLFKLTNILSAADLRKKMDGLSLHQRNSL